jgi:MFS superfamily sulfate permease-like transporter
MTPTGSTEGEDDVAESHSRVRSWGTVAAFTLIIALTVAEGVDEGFSVWDWLVMAAGVVFILQALFRLKESRSGPS